MRWIDDIIKAVEEHPYISPTHKRVLIDRIEKYPTQDELSDAHSKVYPNETPWKKQSQSLAAVAE